MSVSGRSSSCSIIQDESFRQIMCRTPKTPIKTGHQGTPLMSQSKRSLFQSNSPNSHKFDDLGLMTPLSPSSTSSCQSLSSPQFSPNGKFSTPPRTPKTSDSNSPKVMSKRIEIKSSLFPDLNLLASKTKHSTKSNKSLISKMSSSENGSNNFKGRSVSVKKPQRKELLNYFNALDTDMSSNDSGQENKENFTDSDEYNSVTSLGIKPLSCESFYGSSQLQKAHSNLLVGTFEHSKYGIRNLVRSLSKESLSSNRSFVSGGSRKKSSKNLPRQVCRPKSFSKGLKKSNGSKKGIQPGVWHNIKKPKKIKKMPKTDRPLISPKSRLDQVQNINHEEIKVKEKRLFQENPRKRISLAKKRRWNDNVDDENLAKNKGSSPSESNVHPAVAVPNIEPDPSKKFLKYGQTRKATFTLNESVKLQISDGIMRLQTPKKRRKLYSGKRDNIEDFNDFDDGENNIQNSIRSILNILEDNKVEKKSDTQISNVLQVQNNTSTKNKEKTPIKRVINHPMLIINDFESDEEENINPNVNTDKSKNEVSLEKTGNMVSFMTNILVNKDQDLNTSFEFGGNGIENSPLKRNHLYSLFYKQNWSKSSISHECKSITNVKVSSGKKRIIVPDDQYLLDAGQESVGIITCKTCGVMYQAGDFADEALHSNFHNNLTELKFSGWNNERVVGKYPDGRVVMILGTDPKVWWQKILKIAEIVDKELGFPEANVKSFFYKTVYLYISEKSKQIAGCLIAEECKVGYKMFPPIEGVEIDTCSRDPTPCRVGISRIWTALSHRRKGVATRMLECLQKTFFFGDIVGLDQIAFSVPSPAGKLFAQKVTGKMDFLVYGFA